MVTCGLCSQSRALASCAVGLWQAPGLPALCVAALENGACVGAIGRDRLVDVATRAAAVVWERGVLRKGNGLCHGVAGNAYAFLTLRRLLGGSGEADDEQLRRACCFAAVLLDEDVQCAMADTCDPQRRVKGVPDSPLSLMEGSAD